MVLDFWISSDITEMVGLEAALQQLKTLHVPVYASYNVNAAHESVDLSSIDFNEIEARHATDVYDYDLAGPDTGSLGRCHTLFYAEQTMASYENSIALTAADGTVTEIPSLPFRVAHDLNDSKTLGREVQRRGAIIPYGSISEMQNALTRLLQTACCKRVRSCHRRATVQPLIWTKNHRSGDAKTM